MATECLLDSIRSCRLCAPELPVEPRPVLQFHPSARILIASQAPGRIVHETGVPFDDRSGDRLRGWLGVDRERFYDQELFAIAPMAFCFPGAGKSGDLPPRRECAEKWREELLEELADVELVLAVGHYAVAYHLGTKLSLTESVRRWREWPSSLLPLPHPSPRNTYWLRKNGWFEAELVPELRARVEGVLGKLRDAPKAGGNGSARRIGPTLAAAGT
jgi:uracil-DNA glycosylase